MAKGKNPAVLQQKMQNLLADARRENSPWSGWVESARVRLALDVHWLFAMPLTWGSGDLAIFCAFLTTLCKDIQSTALQPQHQIDMQFASRVSMVPQ